MKLALDTQAYSDFCRGNAAIKSAIRAAEMVVVPVIVVGELRAGFRHGGRSTENERVLQSFLQVRRVQIAGVDEETTLHYAALFFHLRRQGTPIPTNDLWIAAIVVQHQFTLLSEDAHFDHLPQVSRYRIPES